MNNKEEWKLEELWDWIASEIGFDGKGNEIQDGIREFVKLKLASQSKSMIEEVEKLLEKVMTGHFGTENIARHNLIDEILQVIASLK